MEAFRDDKGALISTVNHLSQEIEVDFEKIQQNVFENNDKLLLTVEDVGALSIILSEK